MISYYQLVQHTYGTAQMSWVRAPTIPSAHSSHPLLWHKTWVTAVEHL